MSSKLSEGLKIGSVIGVVTFGAVYVPWVGVEFKHNGIKVDSDEIEIQAFVSPFKTVKYSKDVKNDYASLTLNSSFSLESETLLDWDNDGLVDKVRAWDIGIDRGEPGTEELFQHADAAWKEYTDFLNVEQVLKQEPSVSAESKEFNF